MTLLPLLLFILAGIRGVIIFGWNDTILCAPSDPKSGIRIHMFDFLLILTLILAIGAAVAFFLYGWDNDGNGPFIGACATMIFVGVVLLMSPIVYHFEPDLDKARGRVRTVEKRAEPSLTGMMDGNAWNRASSGSKQALAADISRRLSGTADVSSSFVFDALDSFYNSSNPSVLETNISDVVGLSVVAAGR